VYDLRKTSGFHFEEVSMEENREGYGLAEGKILSIWMILFVVLVLLPSMFRVSLGISHFYVKTVIKMLEVS